MEPMAACHRTRLVHGPEPYVLYAYRAKPASLEPVDIDVIPRGRLPAAGVWFHGFGATCTQEVCNALGYLVHGYPFELTFQQCLYAGTERTPVASVDAEVSPEVEQGLLPNLVANAFAFA